ncbi:MAG: sulfate/molybdate ABC transporter ATP-binding protein [Dermatophilaceae bacterium]
MTLDAHLRVTRGPVTLDLPLLACDGEVVAILGPNGAGKTTALHVLAGLARASSGHVRVDGHTWADSSTHRPASERAVGLLVAEHLLLPHLSARGNVAFGPRNRGMTRRAAALAADRELAALGVADLADRRPATLSHGQAQRVALARALATGPRLLLLDEPFSALDLQTRPQVRAALAARLQNYGGTTVLVTHDPLDALTLADHVVFLDRGVVIQQGPPAEVVEHPRTPYVASVVGLNLLSGHSADGRDVETAIGLVAMAGHGHRGQQWVAFPPAAVMLCLDRPEGSDRMVWPATVASVELVGQYARVRLDIASVAATTIVAEITLAALAELRLHPGSPVWAGVTAAEVRAYPA